MVRTLALGPIRKVKTWKRYNINGFNFHTFDYGKNKARCNYGVNICSVDEVNYYGILEDIIELTYCGNNRVYTTVLFKCEWMDPASLGTRVHERYKLVEVKHTRRYPKYDPFVLAHQAQQVYFAPYPTTTNDRSQNQWWAVFKMKARSEIDAPVDLTFFQEDVGSTGATLSPCYDGDNIYDDEYDDSEEVEEGENEYVLSTKNNDDENENEESENSDDEGSGEDNDSDQELGDEDDDDDDDDTEDDEDI